MNTLFDLLVQPESRTLDFKRHEVSLHKALKTLVAFANTAGGTLILGVADDGTVLGIDEVEAEEERYANAVSTSIEPPLDIELEIARHESGALLLVRVPRLPGPFYLRSEASSCPVTATSFSPRTTPSPRPRRRQASC